MQALHETNRRIRRSFESCIEILGYMQLEKLNSEFGHMFELRPWDHLVEQQHT